MLLALNFMHKKNIMHRDLKPENILCEAASDIANDELVIKLTDFGFAVKYDPNKKETLSLGSPLYMAPELCKETQYDFKVDVWAVGVIAFVLLTGTPPFYDKINRGKDGIYQSIIKDEPDYSLLSNVSGYAREFCELALTKDPRDRPTIEDLLANNWIVRLEENQRNSAR